MLPLYELHRPDCVGRPGGRRHQFTSRASEAACGTRGLSILSSRVRARELLRHRELVASLVARLSRKTFRTNQTTGRAHLNKKGYARRVSGRCWIICQKTKSERLAKVRGDLRTVPVGKILENGLNRREPTVNLDRSSLTLFQKHLKVGAFLWFLILLHDRKLL
jgi:hypothetical protein